MDPIMIVAAVVLLGVVILVHEWGHYAAARLCGIRVETFSIGFGPRIWGWKRGSTDFRISILPLGGYVKMAGDNPMEEREGAPDEFLSKARWQRAIVAVAGPVMNIILTLAAVWGLLWVTGVPYLEFMNMPAQVVGLPKDSPSIAAGLQAGDTIVEVNDTPVATWKETRDAVVRVETGDVLRLTVQRGGERVALKMQKPSRANSGGLLGHEPIPAVFDQVLSGRPGAAAGLKPGDQVLAVNGKPTPYWGQFTETVRESSGEPMDFRVKRGDAEFDVKVTPFSIEEAGRTIRQIGVNVRFPLAYQKVNGWTAAQESVQFVWDGSRQILGVLAGLFQGRVSIKQLGGPVEIIRQSGFAAREGIQRFVELVATISLNLAILNLLPIPILDGGHLLLLAVEGTLRRDLSMAIKERFVQVGMVFLLVIFAIVMYNDVLKILPVR